MNKQEILSPAGSMEALRAAIANGADAIYLGGKRFGARASSTNFSDEEIIEAINLAHIHKVKVYVTMNTLIFDHEVTEFLKYAGFLYENQVDAIIVQDLGMFHLLKKNFKDLAIHCSTQMNAVNSLDVGYLTKNGASRVVLARENTGNDIIKIKEKTGAQLEVFAHGALCMSYSGKCLFSAIEGGRSGNRGECSQPCRMKYSLNSNGEKTQEAYFLSTKDLSTIGSINKMTKLPIDSLKIEGRMKRGEYVAKVTSAYKTATSNAENLNQSELNSFEDEIKYIFNRGYTKGYVLSHQGSDISNTACPKNIGVIAGTVLLNDKGKKRLRLKLSEDIQVGDGLSTGEHVGRIIKKGTFVGNAKKGEEIDLDYVGNLQEGDLVYKSYTKSIMEDAKNSYDNFKANYPISMDFELKIGELPRLTIYDEERTVTVEAKDIKGELANVNPISDERIKTQLSKLGDSIFKLDVLKITKDKNSTVPVSVLNYLRREATALAELERTKKYYRKLEKDFNFDLNIVELPEQPISIGVFCNNKEQIRAAADEKVQRVYVKDKELYHIAKKFFSEEKIYYQLPLVIREQELDAVIKDVEKLGDNFIVSSLGIAEALHDKNKIAHYLLNLANEHSLAVVDTQFAMPSLEALYKEPIRYYEYKDSYDKLEIPIYQRPILMVSEYCPYKKENGHCNEAQCKLSNSSLKNAQGHEFPLERDANCKMLVLGKKVERLDKYVKEFVRINITRFSIHLQHGVWAESYTDSRNLIKEYKKLLY